MAKFLIESKRLTEGEPFSVRSEHATELAKIKIQIDPVLAAQR
jgi:hypothetical protein